MLEKDSCHYDKNLRRNPSKNKNIAKSITEYPDHSELIPRLKRIGGQVSGIERMITDGSYCVDILTQFQAVASALRVIEKIIFEKHIMSCVKNAMGSNKPKEIEKKTQELINFVFKRLE
jgi:CsoR family transcriptional regulator, copper-sensing transcriptional repressor